MKFVIESTGKVGSRPDVPERHIARIERAIKICPGEGHPPASSKLTA